MNRPQSRLLSAPPEDLGDSGVRNRTLRTKPQGIRAIRPRVRSPGSEISIERLRSVCAERASARPTALSDDVRDVVVPVDIAEPKASDFGATHPGIEEEQDEGAVAALVEISAVNSLEEAAQFCVAKDCDRHVGHRGRAHPLHRRAFDLAFFEQPPKKLLKPSIAR